MKEKDLIGKLVVSMADGARVGTVEDLAFSNLKLTALVVNGERGEGLLPFKSLEANGPDAITIKSYTQINWSAGKALDPDTNNTNDLRKLTVVDADGNMLGHFHDLTMDTSGQVEEISVRSNGIFGVGAHETIIPASRIHAVGATLITVGVEPAAN